MLRGARSKYASKAAVAALGCRARWSHGAVVRRAFRPRELLGHPCRRICVSKGARLRARAPATSTPQYARFMLRCSL
jgi:hypothetical protein